MAQETALAVAAAEARRPAERQAPTDKHWTRTEDRHKVGERAISGGATASGLYGAALEGK